MEPINHGEYGNLNRMYQRPFVALATQNTFKVNAPMGVLPMSVDLRNIAKVQIYDQGQTGSCSANAVCAAYSMLGVIHLKQPINLSRLFVYYNSRIMDGTQGTDAGAHLYNSFRTMQLSGCCLEYMWPFYPSILTIRPPAICYQEALKHCTEQQNTQLDPWNLLNSIKQCLANNLPVVIGVLVYSSFESHAVATTGYVPMPNIHSEVLLGGHALVAVGYDDSRGLVIVQNSWGNTWGDKGYGYLPYAFISDPNLTSDCHAFTQTEIDRSFNPHRIM